MFRGVGAAGVGAELESSIPEALRTFLINPVWDREKLLLAFFSILIPKKSPTSPSSLRANVSRSSESGTPRSLINFSISFGSGPAMIVSST